MTSVHPNIMLHCRFTVKEARHLVTRHGVHIAAEIDNKVYKAVGPGESVDEPKRAILSHASQALGYVIWYDRRWPIGREA
jgi:hypothetical protein